MKTLNFTGNTRLKRNVLLLLTLTLFFLQSISLFAQDRVKGGYRMCLTYSSGYHNGILDTNKYLIGMNYYNESGKIIIGQYYVNDNLSVFKKYNYNEKGNIIEIYVQKTNKIPQTQVSNKYDENGNMFESWKSCSNVNDENCTTKEYNGKNKLIKKQEFDHDDKLNNYSIYKYDNKGNLIEQYEFSNNEYFFPFGKYFYKNDDNGKLIELAVFTNSPLYQLSSWYKYSYCYDEAGDQIEVYFEQSSDSLNIKPVRKCKYDEFGNKAEEIIFNYLNNPKINSNQPIYSISNPRDYLNEPNQAKNEPDYKIIYIYSK